MLNWGRGRVESKSRDWDQQSVVWGVGWKGKDHENQEKLERLVALVGSDAVPSCLGRAG